MGNHGIRRGRRPRRPGGRGLLHQQYQMDMIGHDHIFIHSDTGDTIAGMDIFLRNLTISAKSNIRGVEGAAPYGCWVSWYVFYVSVT